LSIVDFPDGIPPALVRAFASAEDRSNWDRGNYRLRLLSHYRRLESDVRADRGEGEARHIVLGVNQTPVNFGGSYHNPVYIICFSEPDAPAIRSGKYGTFLSTIPDVAAFTATLLTRFEEITVDTREVFGATLLRVRYSRDAVIDPEPTSEERGRLMIAQKAEPDADDCEWRIAVTLSGPLAGAPEEIWIRQSTSKCVLSNVALQLTIALRTALAYGQRLIGRACS
jgi:hypothetical protein